MALKTMVKVISNVYENRKKINKEEQSILKVSVRKEMIKVDHYKDVI